MRETATFVALTERLLHALPPGIQKLFGLKDREAEAEAALKAALADWNAQNHGHRSGVEDLTVSSRRRRTEAQGKAMAALSYLPAERLLSLAAQSPLPWLRLRAVELLERKPLELHQVVGLWNAVAAVPALAERVGRIAAARLRGKVVPPSLPVELLAAAADAETIGESEALEALLARRPPPLPRLIDYFRRGLRSERLVRLIRAGLPSCDFRTLARLKESLGSGSPFERDFPNALAAAAARLPAQDLGRAAEDFPEHAPGVILDEIVRRLGHLSSPIGRKHAARPGRPRRREEEHLRELGRRLLAHARPEEAEKLIDEILSLELRRAKSGKPAVCAREVGLMLCRYPTGVVGAQAAKALGLIGARSALAPLSEAASSLDENIRQKALSAIDAINARSTRKTTR